MSVSAPRAEDTKGKWQFGFGLSYFSTTDYIRSNADIAVSEKVVGEGGVLLPSVQSVDARPDINILNEPSINDDFKVDVNASYGLTRWLAFELSAGYLKSSVGNIEYYSTDQTKGLAGSPASSPNSNCGPNLNKTCYTYTANVPFNVRTNSFLPVGTVTEIPVQLSAIARFRPESPLGPYLGLGVGYIFTDLKTEAPFREKAQEIDSKFVTSADKGDFTTEGGRSSNCGPNFDQVCVEFSPGPITANVKDAFQWHAVGGIDYFVNERFSFYVDARYVWTSGAVDIRTDGFPQVQLTIVDEGQLLLLRRGSDSQPYLWEDTGVRGTPGGPVYGAGDSLYATEDKFGGIQNTTTEGAEDDGVLFLLPPNTRDLAEGVDRVNNETGAVGADGKADTIFCPECMRNGIPDTEDRNGNLFMDTHLLYGVDICTFGSTEFIGLDGKVKRADMNPKCFGDANGNGRLDPGEDSKITNTQFHVWPQDCAPTPAQVSLDFKNLDVKANVGCPAFPDSAPTATTESDNAADVFIVQGGRIKLGGFSLGLGFKFLF